MTGALRAKWTYDTLAKGQLTSSTRYDDGAAYVTATTAYDDGYRPLGQSVTLPSAEGVLAGTYTTSYTYTADGQLKTLKHPAAGGLGAETVTTYYDALSIPDWTGGGFGWGVYVAGSLYSPYGEPLLVDLGATNSYMLNYSYENGTRRPDQTWLQREGQAGYDLDLTYDQDAAGNLTSVVDRATGKPVDAQCVTYDGLRRLTEAWTPSSALCATAPSVAGLGGPAPYWTSYAFDTVGNRTSSTQHKVAGNTSSTYAYPAAGGVQPHALSQVTETVPGATVSTDSFIYDAAGNTTGRTLAGQPAQTLTWDAEGKLDTLTEAGGTAEEYVYTTEGDRLIRHQDGTTTAYLPGGDELTLTDATGIVKATRYYTFNGQTVAVRTAMGASGVSTLIADQHGTAEIAINNSTHAVTQRRHDPYGNTRGTAPAAWAGDHGFLNKPTDTSGLTQVGARYYDAMIGRFISVDPVMDMMDPQQWNGYAYSNNNPTTYSDPTGLLASKSSSGKSGSFVSALNKLTQRIIRTVTPPVRLASSPPSVTSSNGGTRGQRASKSFWDNVGGAWSSTHQAVGNAVDDAGGHWVYEHRKKIGDVAWAIGAGAAIGACIAASGGLCTGLVIGAAVVGYGNDRFIQEKSTGETNGNLVMALIPGGGRIAGELKLGEGLLRAGDELGNLGVVFRSDTAHIFRNSPGHLIEDTVANREIIYGAVRPENLRSTTNLPGDRGTLQKYFQTRPDGTQAWAEVRNGNEITNGGLNGTPR